MKILPPSPNCSPRWLQPLVLLALFVSQPCRGADIPAGKRLPNILWIVSEDNNPLLGCYGDKFAHTPNLDKLAAEGVIYLNAFANAPVCAPSRSTMITGVYASTLGTLHMRSRYPIPPEFAFYCTYLKEAGYYCMNPGKTDYNIAGDDKKPWDPGKSWKDAPGGKPWMLVINSMTTHESSLHGSVVHEEYLKEPFTLPPYHPDTPEIRSNWVEYYHKMAKMDAEYGVILDKLQADGLADDTIVFYYSDHGGILPRSKRFVYDSGLHVPFIVRFGKNMQHLAPAPPGTKLDRLISFVDLAPTLLSMVGAKIPPHFQGQAFLGREAGEPRRYVLGFRGRMDERYDLSYTVRDKQYRLIHNYMPHRIYGQHLDYLWKMPATVSWQAAFLAGKCDAMQSAFWREKPTEELYDETADPYEVHNLVDSPQHAAALDHLRAALHEQLLKNRDAGLLPESDMLARARGGPIFAMTHDERRYPFERILAAADLASRRDDASMPQLIEWMKDSDAAVRYWAAVGCCVRGERAMPAAAALEPLVRDASPCVRIAADEALVRLGHADALTSLVNELDIANGDPLLAVNTLEALGDLARPAIEAITAKVRKGLPGEGRMNGEAGDRYSDRAAASLVQMLGKP